MINLKTLGTIATYINGRAFKPSEWEDEGLPIIRIQNLSGSTKNVHYTKQTYENKYLLKNGDLLFAWAATLDAYIWKGNDAWLNQHIFKIIPNDNMDKLYIYYYLKKVILELYAKTHGSGMIHITKKPFMNTLIPVPPLVEQKRIVARIEELFSELDQAEEMLRKTLKELELYRKSILIEAFNDLRNKAPTPFVKDVCVNIKVGIVIKPTQFYTDDSVNGIKVFRSANVQEFRVKDSDWVYFSKENNSNNYRTQVHFGDVLVVRSGVHLGMSCIVPDEYEGCNAIDILIATPDKQLLLPEYLCAFTNSPLGIKSIEKHKRGVAQPHLNVSGYGKLSIPLPSLEEQKMIVDKIQNKLSLYKYIRETVLNANNQSKTLRQSILKKAFEGGL